MVEKGDIATMYRGREKWLIIEVVKGKTGKLLWAHKDSMWLVQVGTTQGDWSYLDNTKDWKIEHSKSKQAKSFWQRIK